ncbi:hypothetical protein BJ165DRAFT_1347432 [Panaeolus papilionaceus]|nr:hypothetical protein BJ165DRAFT_1347432 [Panaeolus papilionaceus]
MESTLSDFLKSQEELVQEAALALPHSFSQCTYSLGSIRQSVYLCLTCPESRGLCSACSVACHTDHEQVELFPKRNFHCDCPTAAIAHACTLHKKLERENTTNQYGQNFQGKFCRCSRVYDANQEKETMIQCLSCEDWFHESCCNLRERPSSRECTPVSPRKSGVALDPDETTVQDDAASDTSSSGLPPPLISGEEYESFICGQCVSKSALLQRWAGTCDTIMVVRDSPDDPWRRLNCMDVDDQRPIEVDDTQEATSRAGTKRPLSPSALEEPDAKRVKPSHEDTMGFTTCLTPPQHPLAKHILSSLDNANAVSALGAGDLFLTSGFRDRWCRCQSCLPSLKQSPWLLEEEETYEPPEDPDSGLSLEELGMRALQRLPREKAINGIHAFNEMRDDLVKFLRPFAQENKVVNESDVRGFFEALKQAQQDKKDV